MRMLETDQPTPVDGLREETIERLGACGRVVFTAPTGSGKSTRVPMWCTRGGARVLVVEPRRLACRALARYVARLTGSTLGQEVGFAVRHEAAFTARSRIVFATPGTVLRMMQEAGPGRRALGAWDTLVLDEFHERQIDVDLLLGFAQAEALPELIVMSATLDVERLGRFVQGAVIEGHGRLYDVGLEHLDAPTLPEIKGLEGRVVEGVERALRWPGDALVFLPGKAEISACRQALRGLAEREGLEVLALHGDLSPEAQDQVFAAGAARRVILSTNVAETSVTLPGIGVVIDSGLVRQKRYHGGRGVLRLVPISEDSAEQRKGRAGRLGPGHCVRLWGRAGNLEARTPPEIMREDLTDAALRVASCGHRLSALRLLDPPAPYAVEAAEAALTRLGCLDAAGGITEVGLEVGALPVDARQGRFLVEARACVARGEAPERVLVDAIDLVAAMGVERRLLSPPSGAGQEVSEARAGWRQAGCDATLAALALRVGDARRDGLHPVALAEGRRVAAQLRGLLGVGERGAGRLEVDRGWLARLWIRADPHTAYVRRRRGDAFGRDGAEVELQRGSLIGDRVEVIVAPEVFSLKIGARLIKQATCPIPMDLAVLRDEGLGVERVESARMSRGRLSCTIVRSFSGRTLEEREESPRGALCRRALHMALMQGSLFREAIEESRARAWSWNLYRRLKRLSEPAAIDVEAWVEAQIEALGVESGEDAALLIEDDFLVPWPAPLDEGERRWLERDYPSTFNVGDAAYTVHYDTAHRVVTLDQTQGKRRQAPSLTFLPSWGGWRIQWKRGNAISVLRT